MTSEAEVWRQNSVSKPSRMLLSATHEATESVKSCSPGRIARIDKTRLTWRSIRPVSRRGDELLARFRSRRASDKVKAPVERQALSNSLNFRSEYADRSGG